MSTSKIKKISIRRQHPPTKLMIKNGRVVNADGVFESDILIEDGVIKEMGKYIKESLPQGTRGIDAKGKLIFPGGVDPHVHLNPNFFKGKADDFYRGTKAAIAGGTTTIIDFFDCEKDQSLIDAYYKIRRLADAEVCCDYSLHCVVKNCNENTKKEMEILMGDNFGINSFKFFMAYPDLMLQDPQLYELFETCRKIGALPLVHAENGEIILQNTKRLLASGITSPIGHALSRPEDVEAEAVTRAAMIANQTCCPLYVVHVMSKAAAEAVALAQSHGQLIIGETVAAALGTNGLHYKNENFEHAAGHVLSPPLRIDMETQGAMMKYLKNNVLQLSSSGHCAYTTDIKALGKNNFSLIPNGVNGIEERLSIVWEYGVKTGLLNLPRFVEVTSTNAAKIFNLYPRKGVLAVGSDADIVIWNPNQNKIISTETHVSACNFNIFNGTLIHGAPEYVIVHGKICLENSVLTPNLKKQLGKFVPTKAWSPFIYDSVKESYDNFSVGSGK